MLKLFYKLFPEAESFKSSWLWFLNFRNKIWVAIIIFIFGVLALIFITCRQFEVRHRELSRMDSINQQLDAIKALKYQSTLLLNRCVAAAGSQRAIDLGNSLGNLNKVMIRLTEHLKTGTGDLASNAYKNFGNTLISYSIYEMDKVNYSELQRSYQKFYGLLVNLEKELLKKQAGQLGGIIFNSLMFIGVTLLLLIVITGIGGWIIVIAVKTITEPAALVTKYLQNDEPNKGSLAVFSAEGLGAAAFNLKGAEPAWKEIYVELKDSAKRLDEQCQELVAGIKVQEIFEVQIDEAHKAIKSYVEEQRNMTVKANEQGVFLVSNLSSFQKIPFKLKTFVAQIQDLLNTMETKLQAALSTQYAFKDCSLEINSLFEDLSFTSAKIIEVVKILKEVAGQAELLAFNTAIEAARAGSKGLGFGVVSKEIAKLVERSQKASEDLNSLITQVQDGMNSINDLIPQATITNEITASFQQSVSNIYTGTFNTTRASIDDLLRLTQVFEDIITKSSEITKQASQISNLDFKEKEELKKMEIEILDYQLNVKESVRIASKVDESVKNFNAVLADLKTEQY